MNVYVVCMQHQLDKNDTSTGHRCIQRVTETFDKAKALVDRIMSDWPPSKGCSSWQPEYHDSHGEIWLWTMQRSGLNDFVLTIEKFEVQADVDATGYREPSVTLRQTQDALSTANTENDRLKRCCASYEADLKKTAVIDTRLLRLAERVRRALSTYAATAPDDKDNGFGALLQCVSACRNALDNYDSIVGTTFTTTGARYAVGPDAQVPVTEPTNWTVDPVSRRSNSSPVFVAIAKRVAEIIRNSANDLLQGHSETVGRSIVAQLAHIHHLAPTKPASWK